MNECGDCVYNYSYAYSPPHTVDMAPAISDEELGLDSVFSLLSWIWKWFLELICGLLLITITVWFYLCRKELNESKSKLKKAVPADLRDTLERIFCDAESRADAAKLDQAKPLIKLIRAEVMRYLEKNGLIK